ncbi:ABC transporter substrate-binding protein [Acidomonas methanolica]|nr:ABC transporter substrate-binding protein [Acidomonas methanolica]
MRGLPAVRRGLSRFPAVLVLGPLCCCIPVRAEDSLPAAHRGGTLHLAAVGSGGTLDPQINYTAEYINLFVTIYDGLTGFRKARGPAGDTVMPDLAEAIPAPQDGGRTYVFTLRDGIRFSDGRKVTVEDVAASFRRLFRVGSPTAGAFYGDIAGAKACLADPAHCTLAEGVRPDPVHRTVTFHLTAPDTEFMMKLAFTHASILPADTPDHDTGNNPVPGTGPYHIVSYNPEGGIVAERNPYFHVWNAEVQPPGYVDRIEYRFGLTDEAAVTAIENGQTDWIYDPIPLDRLGELGARFTSQTHIEPHLTIYFAPMNVHIPPFDSEKARQAVDYAINRHAMTILYGGPAIAQPLCSLVPPELTGRMAGCPYTKGADFAHPAPEWKAPDLERARELVRESGTAGQKVTLVVANRSVDRAMGNELRDTLDAIGYHADLKPLAPALMFDYIQNSNNHVQIAIKDWSSDFPSASNFLDGLFGCENFHPGSNSSVNISGFCDGEVQALIDRAKTDVTLTDAQRADLWAQVDALLARHAPGAPIIHKYDVTFVSKRLGNFFYTHNFGLFFSQVWVR